MKTYNTKEPVRQHYIPQFILKNFCFNNKGELYFFFFKNKETTIKSTKEIFMEKQLYNSTNVNFNNPTQIEKDFAKYEQEIALLIKTKIIDQQNISLTLQEEKSLHFFCALLGFRSKNVKDTFANPSNESKALYSQYQSDGNFVELWKRNLSVLVKCRSLDEVIKRNDVDDFIKSFMKRDCSGISSQYFVFFEKRGPIDFVIGDCYPVVISGSTNFGISLDLISFFPLTPYFCMALVNNGSENSPCMLNLKKYLKKPHDKNGILEYRIQKLYEHDIKSINKKIIKNSHSGVAFQDKKRSGIMNLEVKEYYDD